ncbi:N-acetylmuramoyl-L-alanine amidase [Weissella oryzae SG25]|uniref:N-acetylmuramoyl-L-alanine amidase n=1 Tax=Weissella oryzae (strain DSM 25784 / JCM 18191 / LMG 30913 / SG25) TaxID=1329250 RepID=A0A069CRY0_WEIOS|nr:lytic exoenzyme target recognition domain-containing protein [Weissella oryzae]GAK30555.1 N-acetylmuramoyl-L-alanine amidase [Weissella oryzae SG25]
MVEVIEHIVVPGRPALDEGHAKPPFEQVHLHSTGNITDSLEGEKNYLATNYESANYTHIVGWNPKTKQAEAWQVMATNGGAYDVGGDWNWEAYAAIEFAEGSITNREQFFAAYQIYIELTRQLAVEAGLTDFTLDTSATPGIKTHNYASATGHGSDHVDPLPFLASWGVSYEQLKQDVFNGTASQPKPDKGIVVGATVAPYRNDDEQKGNLFIADAVVSSGGIDQLASYVLVGGADQFTWANNGVPTALVDEYDSTGEHKTDDQIIQVGSYFRFNVNFVITSQNINATNKQSYSFIVPVGYNAGYGFWVLTSYLKEIA